MSVTTTQPLTPLPQFEAWLRVFERSTRPRYCFYCGRELTTWTLNGVCRAPACQRAAEEDDRVRE